MSAAVPLRALADALDAGMSLRAFVDDRALGSILPPAARIGLSRALDVGPEGALATESPIAHALSRAGVVDVAGAAVIAAGERGGFLPRALRLVADDIAEQANRKRRAVLALAYPAFLVVMASVILPLPVLVTHGAGAYAGRAAPGVLAIAAVAFTALFVVPRLPQAVRGSLTALLGRLPVLGVLVVDTARASCFEVLGRVLAAGVPVTLALPAALAAGGLSSWSPSAAQRAIDAGGTLADALSAAGVVGDGDRGLLGRIAIGEKTGKLDGTLPALANEARGRARARFVAVTAVAGLACFIGIAVAIGSALIGQQRAYFDAIDAASKE